MTVNELNNENQPNEINEEVEAIKKQILTALETVIDPELGIDIVNLGLVYDVDLDVNGLCTVQMTLTTMGCPLADVITDEVHRALISLEAVNDTAVKLVWYPAWTPDRMSRYARISLGISR
ncbi:metal-sulfur cluster assembly factor [Atopobacter phocae]|uniref:metal-sulfur cluster assembly factor n=1 Tax=Atopobacter phocae TaxID=136492 RepID=UPI000470B423|nr:metal-sulfur cluster assembly factor [Atopobacter phocae]